VALWKIDVQSIYIPANKGARSDNSSSHHGHGLDLFCYFFTFHLSKILSSLHRIVLAPDSQTGHECLSLKLLKLEESLYKCLHCIHRLLETNTTYFLFTFFSWSCLLPHFAHLNSIFRPKTTQALYPWICKPNTRSKAKES
jgi:hypothetical protein